MNPQAEQVRLPAGYRLERRPSCQPLTHEQSTVRDRNGAVLAQIDIWRPDQLPD
jgi:hypothetical protein